MDKNVEILLAAEAEVNKMVKEALERKNEQMKNIKKQADIDLKSYRLAQEKEFERKLAEVTRAY